MSVEKMKIDFDSVVISYIYPPIPCRRTDYCATIKGDEEGFSGWGETAAAALLDLAERLVEYEQIS
jgi:hypothetical protein